MTAQEREVWDLLAAAWKAFLQLPEMHNDDTTEFRQGIHQCQNTVLARPTLRGIQADDHDRSRWTSGGAERK